MEGILINTYKHDNIHHHHHTQQQQQQQQEQEYWKHLRQADNDHRSREAILRHLQPYIETERLRQHQRQVHQLQQQNHLQQQLLSQQEKRLAEELEWLQRHQRKQAAAIERQRQAALLRGGQKAQAGGEGEIQQDDRSGLVKQGALVGLSVQELWGRIPSTKNHIQPNERHQHQQQTQPHQQQTQQQTEVEKRQHREKRELWELYKLRKQQEQEIVERRQLQQQQLQQALLSNKLEQQPSVKKDEAYSELIKPGPSPGQESKSSKALPRYNRPLIPAPLNWVQSTIDIDNNNQNGIEDSDDDEEVGFEGEDHLGQHYNQQDQYDWRGLRRLSKVYVPLPRRKRGRKGRGDFFEDDYHAGFNKIEIHTLSSAGKAAYEAQRQNRQHHDAPPLPGAVIA
ncbi:hypothetical protein KI688_010471 [Linnemannia hyalina]|uniref:Uncharacterized protein n=1 Tax=Linnemannia hyalina TaxID=64524 RepID=A0A9P8BY58_9FUNG|nr:hypothetical protein KI688_010471 [Linnemannia hyalina]